MPETKTPWQNFEKTWRKAEFLDKPGRMYDCRTANLSIFMLPEYCGNDLIACIFYLILDNYESVTEAFHYTFPQPAVGKNQECEQAMLSRAGSWAMQQSAKYLHTQISNMSTLVNELDQDIYDYLISDFIES